MRQAYSQRLKWARTMEESGCSSSENWMTPRVAVGDYTMGRAADPRAATDLTAQTQMWMTPRAGKTTSEDPESWNPRRDAKAVASPPLPMQAANWRTPSASDPEGGIMDIEYAKANNLDPKIKLRDQAANWPTPTARDHKDGTSAETVDANGLLGRVAPAFSLPAPATSEHGHESSQAAPTSPRRTRSEIESWLRRGDYTDFSRLESIVASAGRPPKRRLNERFVEWLMGLPEGWVTGPTTSDSSAMELSRWSRDMRSRLSTLLSSQTASEQGALDL